jgi:hypothetical protein
LKTLVDVFSTKSEITLSMTTCDSNVGPSPKLAQMIGIFVSAVSLLAGENLRKKDGIRPTRHRNQFDVKALRIEPTLLKVVSSRCQLVLTLARLGGKELYDRLHAHLPR